eukprot:2390544-Prymnesium_polylepis.1
MARRQDGGGGSGGSGGGSSRKGSGGDGGGGEGTGGEGEAVAWVASNSGRAALRDEAVAAVDA